MEAVIIAAGDGSRLSRYYSPKPLTPIFGLRLIERIILAGKRAGITDFKIVVGYKAARIKRELGDGTRYGVRLTYIDNPDWEKGNGISVLSARGHVGDRFLLLMSDHLFDETILNKLKTVDSEDERCILCIDTNVQGDHFSLEDVTKVQLDGDRVKHIDKGLGRFNAIDTGIFLCTPAIFDALEESTRAGRYSLSAGNQILAERGLLKGLDVTGAFWVDVDDEAALEKARQVLIQQLFKPTDGPISRNVNRRLSTRLSAHLARYNVSPNSLTLVSFGLALLSALLFTFGGYVNILLAGLMAQVSSVLDGCDGEIARLKFRFSKFGEWLDKVLDRYADGLIVLGMTYALWQTTADESVWLIGFFALTGTFMNSYTASFYDALMRQGLNGMAWFRIGRDVRMFVIFVGALLNQLFGTLSLLAVMTNVEAIRRLFLLKERYALEEAS